MPSKTDIWMPLYIGDILADTAHLDAERFGCYMLWLMHYWRKGPLSGNIDDLVGIGKLRGKDAPSIAQELLSEFFTVEEDSRWHQKRADIEKILWQGKQLKAQEKAKNAAAARWGNDAPSIPQVMPTPCPSPSPSPSPLTTKDLKSYPPPLTLVSDGTKEEAARLKALEKAAAKEVRAAVDAAAKVKVKKILDARKVAAKKAAPPTKTDAVRARHTEFKVAIFEYWKSNNEVDCPWQGPEGMQLEMWLQSSPTVTVTQFKKMLRNRYRSEVNHSDRPSVWLKDITKFANHPIDRFGQPLVAGGNKANGKIERTVHSAGELIFEIEDRHGAGGSELLQRGGTE